MAGAVPAPRARYAAAGEPRAPGSGRAERSAREIYAPHGNR